MDSLALFKKIKLLISDVDGVLTAGDIIISDQGQEAKVFNVHDGFGIKLLLANKIEFAIISSRNVPSVTHRMQGLGVKHVYQGFPNKRPALQELLQNLQLTTEQVAYVGDDWADLPILNQVGLPIAVANAVEEVKAKARYITHCEGGKGAIREVAMKILQAQGFYQAELLKYN